MRVEPFLRLFVGALCIGMGAGGLVAAESNKPNILWLSAEDIGPHLGCYGDPHARTPHLDELATQAARFTKAFTTAGVCAPCRSGIITGLYQTTLGTHHMRCRAELPQHIQPFPCYLRQAGYYCTNNSKQDYQFQTPAGTWDESSSGAHWRNRSRPDQPFFAVFNFVGCHESGIADTDKYHRVTKELRSIDRQKAADLTTLPPYYADTPKIREDWKRNYELITAMDAWAGNLIDQLKQDGLYENTILMFWSDHGVGLPRAKRWLYDSGVHIPLIVRVPQSIRIKGQAQPGTVTDQLVSSIDFGPAVLNLAGVKIPESMQGRPFLGPNLPAPREFVFGARDRMDERYDIIRMVRDKRYKYLRNYEPLKAYYQYMNTPEHGVTMRTLRTMHDAGELPRHAERLFSAQKPVEELYDTRVDPHELQNLAGEPEFDDILKRMRAAHLAWVTRTKDLGLIAEPILAEREKVLGHRYGILRADQGDALARRVAETAVSASSGPEAIGDLVRALRDVDAAVRYWAAMGVGNLAGQHAVPPVAFEQMRRLLNDSAPTVRIAAARALCRHGETESALLTLARELSQGAQWERLQAAIVLDELDEQARPMIEAMRSALTPRTDLYAGGKYTVRVINRALNELEGTDNKVR